MSISTCFLFCIADCKLALVCDCNSCRLDEAADVSLL